MKKEIYECKAIKPFVCCIIYCGLPDVKTETMDARAVVMILQLSFVVIKGQDIGNTKYSARDAADIVERHNYFRSNTKPSASNMRRMVRIII